jgi:hypothetical protein
MFAQQQDDMRGLVPGAAPFGSAWARAEVIDWALFSVFIAGLAWVPYWYGSNDFTPWGVNAVLFPGLALVYELFVVVRGEGHPVGLKEIKIPAALFVAVVLWILVQDATWTPSLLRHPIWAMSADALGKPVEGSISVNRDLTTLALVRMVTAASVFWIALQLCRNGLRATYFIWSIVAIVAAYCAYGLMLFASTQLANTLSHNFVTSTFYNRNHFATYAGIGLVAACGLILQIYQREFVYEGGSFQFKLATFVEATQKTAVPLGLAFLILVTVLLTGSRGGIIAACLGLAVLSVMTSSGRVQGSRNLLTIIAFGGLVVGASFLAFGDMFSTMVGEKGLYDENRFAVLETTFRSVFDAPMLGYGYGTFIDVFPMIRDRSISVEGNWQQAHNTYLEVFQGLGLVFGSLLVMSVVSLIGKCFKGATTRKHDAMIPGIAFGVAFLVAFHALVEFSLQMQAVTLTFMGVLGAGVAQSISSRLDLRD